MILLPWMKQNGLFGDKINYADDPFDALIDADCLVIPTEWPEFRFPNFKVIKKLLKDPVIFDGRNIYDVEEMKERGFKYFCIGIDTTKLANGLSN